MIRFGSTAKLQIVLAGATTTTALQAIACYSDDDGVSTYAGNWAQASSNGATDVDLVAAPSSGVIRDIDYLGIKNRDTVAATVTVKVDVSGTDYIHYQVTLDSGDHLEFTHGSGWKVTNSVGGLKTGSGSSSGGGGLVFIDEQDVTGLSAVDFLTLATTTYYAFLLVFENLLPATNDVALYLRTGVSGTFAASATNYKWSHWYNTQSGGNPLGQGGSTPTDTAIVVWTDVGNTASSAGISGRITAHNLGGTTHNKQFKFEAIAGLSTSVYQISGGGTREATAAVTDLRLLLSSGAFTSGFVQLYGYARA